MGFGDPYHKHPLKVGHFNTKEELLTSDCFYCELPFAIGRNYSCEHCYYYIHISCSELPLAIRHPLHDQHPLTLFSDTTTNFCNECHEPCLGNFAYHCPTCQLFFHLKCIFSLKHEKHKEHPLIFDVERWILIKCSMCGYEIDGFHFACHSCNLFIHPECTLIPQTVKCHHIHELTLRYDFPEESEQVYCDLCEDRDGEELDRTLAYYYCERCDYIAHVRCCITDPKGDSLMIKRFTHEHPLRLSRDPTDDDGSNVRLKKPGALSHLCCKQCNYVVRKSSPEIPSLIKHPSHPEHALAFVKGEEGEGDKDFFACTNCEFTIKSNRMWFTHPLQPLRFEFVTSNRLFRCDACGGLGEGSRMSISQDGYGNIDLHLECFALPGNLEHESHPQHSLCLTSPEKNVSRYVSVKSQLLYCNVCGEEIDPQLWTYCCQVNDYVAHLNCVASDLLSTLRSFIKNEPDFCAIIEPDKASFGVESLPSVRDFGDLIFDAPYFICGLQGMDFDDKANSDEELRIEEVTDTLRCPKCNIIICNQAYSCVEGWESNHAHIYERISFATLNSQSTFTYADPLTLLDEQIVDEIYCHICSQLIFPPTYSCTSCQIYFHKSCAELPRKHRTNGSVTYELVAPRFDDGMSSCSKCSYPITGYAYADLSSIPPIMLDVHCALGAPSMKHKNHEHHLISSYKVGELINKCNACGDNIDKGKILFTCIRFPCQMNLHQECALLPPVVKHRIHQHPLELASDLAELDDEYICDVCEAELNPDLWAYRCLDSCKSYATSHVSCVITSKRECHFNYTLACQSLAEDQKILRSDERSKAVDKDNDVWSFQDLETILDTIEDSNLRCDTDN